jgi:hypothetical protein
VACNLTCAILLAYACLWLRKKIPAQLRRSVAAQERGTHSLRGTVELVAFVRGRQRTVMGRVHTLDVIQGPGRRRSTTHPHLRYRDASCLFCCHLAARTG